MKSTFLFAGLCALAVLGSGCASLGDTPVIFVQSNTAGISIGASAADQGADFVLGYKGFDFAIVPISVVQNDGRTLPVRAEATSEHSDALSVFGQFEVSSNTDAKTPKVGLGKFFATGQAARRLAEGYATKMGDRPSLTGGNAKGDCAILNPKQGTDRPNASGNAQASSSGDTQKPGTSDAAPASAPDAAKATAQSMIFAEYITFGFILSGSVAEGSAGVTVGYKDRDFAYVPSIARHSNREAWPLIGRTGAHSDALSVLGQFSADSKSGDDGSLDVSLGKFFATGLAAKRLADGFAAKLCEQYAAPASK